MKDITIENVMEKIKENLDKAKGQQLDINYTIATSSEAKEKRMTVEGLDTLDLGWKHKLKQALKRIPVASNSISWIYKLIKLPSRFHELSDDYIIHKAETAKRDRIVHEELKQMNSHLIFAIRKLEMLNYELKKRAGLDINQAIKEIANKNFSPESYTYFAFENTFRGSREVIKKRQLEYLDYIMEAYKKSGGDYLLDIGCGRGELLEILSENNIPSKGIDINEENINFCKEINLNVELSDALKFMNSIKDNSLIGVTAFQVVEHLNTEYLIEFIKASFQKIKGGGVIILETVNPLSLSSLMNFFTDLTHRNPIPPITLKFLTEASGFTDVEIKYSSPIPDNMKLKGDDENTKILNRMIFGFQDYAVIGRKGLL